MDSTTKLNKNLSAAILNRIIENLEDALHWINEYNRLAPEELSVISIADGIHEWLSTHSKQENNGRIDN